MLEQLYIVVMKYNQIATKKLMSLYVLFAFINNGISLCGVLYVLLIHCADLGVDGRIILKWILET